MNSSEAARIERVNAVWGGDAAIWTAGRGEQWFSCPAVISRLNIKVSGNPAQDAYGHLLEFLRNQGRSIPFRRAASIGCGSGMLERGLGQYGLVGEIDGYDLATGAIEAARSSCSASGIDNVRYHVFDLETQDLPQQAFDLAFAHQALHHIENLERVYDNLHMAIVPDGILHLHEFIGPTRFQWTDTQLQEANAWLASVPERLRRVPDGRLRENLQRPSVAEMIAYDPSEAVRSSELLPLLQRRFEVFELCGLGGTLVHLALADIAQNFALSDLEAQHHLSILFQREDELMASGAITSDFAVITAIRRP